MLWVTHPSIHTHMLTHKYKRKCSSANIYAHAHPQTHTFLQARKAPFLKASPSPLIVRKTCFLHFQRTQRRSGAKSSSLGACVCQCEFECVCVCVYVCVSVCQNRCVHCSRQCVVCQGMLFALPKGTQQAFRWHRCALQLCGCVFII
jgi:hypothetical protein